MHSKGQITCFISHTWAEGQHGFAKLLCKRLQRYKRLNVWLDESELAPGDHIQDKISAALEQQVDVFLCILSPEYISSGNCKSELSKAYRLFKENKIRLIPILLSKVDLPLEVEGLLSADFRRAINKVGEINESEFEIAIKSLVKGINEIATKPKQVNEITPHIKAVIQEAAAKATTEIIEKVLEDTFIKLIGEFYNYKKKE